MYTKLKIKIENRSNILLFNFERIMKMANEQLIMSKLDEIVTLLTNYIGTSEERFEKIDDRFEKIEERFEKTEGDLQALRNGQKWIRMDLQKMSQRIDDTYELALNTWGDHEETKAKLSTLEG